MSAPEDAGLISDENSYAPTEENLLRLGEQTAINNIALAICRLALTVSDLAKTVDRICERGYIWVRVSGYPEGNLDKTPLDIMVHSPDERERDS